MAGRARSALSCASKHTQERAADLGGGPLVIGEQLLPGAQAGVAHPAGEPQQLEAALRNAVDGAVADDPQPGLQTAQEAVTAGERRVILRAEMAMLQEQRERLRRVCRAYRWLRRPVRELEELHRELHVNEASAPQFGIVQAA